MLVPGFPRFIVGHGGAWASGSGEAPLDSDMENPEMGREGDLVCHGP